MKGKVIHRHDGKDASHLTGHVNIQKIGGVPSFPVTVHVSDIKPHITEETDMQNENVYTMIDSIQTGDTDRVETLFREIMNTKISDVHILGYSHFLVKFDLDTFILLNFSLKSSIKSIRADYMGTRLASSLFLSQNSQISKILSITKKGKYAIKVT